MGAEWGPGSQNSNPASNKFLQAWLSLGLLAARHDLEIGEREACSNSKSQNSGREGQMSRVVSEKIESRLVGLGSYIGFPGVSFFVMCTGRRNTYMAYTHRDIYT